MIQDQELYDYFLREMDYLRKRARHFSEDYDDVARELRMSESKSNDPHVELLLQSFAYLSASVRRDMASQATHLPNQLLSILYPHLVKPAPSMFVIQPDVSSENTKFEGLKILDRGREFYANIHSNKRGTLKCSVSTCYATPLRPFEISSIEFSSSKHISTKYGDVLNESTLKTVNNAHSALKVSIQNIDDRPTREFDPSTIRFYIKGEKNRPQSPYKIYDLLANDCFSILIQGSSNRKNEDETGFQVLQSDSIRWLGFDDQESVLPFNSNSHSGYRVIQEYFLFPEKFLFFELSGINKENLGKKFDIYFLLSSLPDKDIKNEKDILQLNSIPVVNLYKTRLNSIKLDEKDHEYRLVGDVKNHASCEVHTLTEVSVIPGVGDPIIAQPYAGVHARVLHDSDRFYSTRTEINGLKSIPGTEMFISLHRGKNTLQGDADDILSAKALCTNRRLAESLRVGDALTLIGPGPILSAKLITKPTMHKTPELNSDKPWRLLSNLVLNASSLVNDGLDILKSTLLVYSDKGAKSHFAQVSSLSGISVRKIVKHVGKDQWRGHCRGIEVTIEIDTTKFDGASIHLFGEVLNTFFGLFVNINSFVQCKVILKQEKGIFKTWPPLAGNQILL